MHDVHDIENIVVNEAHGIPVPVRDVAGVMNLGHAPRLGVVGHDDEPDIIQGIVLMRYGGETPSTLEGIYDRVNHIRKYHLLPPGVDIVPYYDRGALVHVTTHTVLENLLLGMLLVAPPLNVAKSSLRLSAILPPTLSFRCKAAKL